MRMRLWGTLDSHSPSPGAEPEKQRQTGAGLGTRAGPRSRAAACRGPGSCLVSRLLGTDRGGVLPAPPAVPSSGTDPQVEGHHPRAWPAHVRRRAWQSADHCTPGQLATNLDIQVCWNGSGAMAGWCGQQQLWDRLSEGHRSALGVPPQCWWGVREQSHSPGLDSPPSP